MEIKVTKLTDAGLLRKCASFTTGKECGMSLKKAYAAKHSIIRTQLFVIELTGIPLFCASQFVRSTQGVNWYQRSKRTDRGGTDFQKVCDELMVDLMMVDSYINIGEEYEAKHSLRALFNAICDLPKGFDRYSPTDLLGVMNAEAIMNMSAKRLCAKASKETREIWEKVLDEVAKVEEDLVQFCVPPCVEHGLCRESKPCGRMDSAAYGLERERYVKLFNRKS